MCVHDLGGFRFLMYITAVTRTNSFGEESLSYDLSAWFEQKILIRVVVFF
jgi:hypothetical protein